MDTPRMRPSRVLAKLRAGEVANCFKLNLADVRATEIAAMAGFDCLWTGMEHIGNDLTVIQHQILAAKAHGVDTLCRVPRGSYSDYIRPLELDAAGIMVPHVMGLEDAKNVVRMTRFHPVGRRAADGGNADAAYCQVPFVDYIEQANRERFVILQIEDPEPLEELEAIADLPGYDILLFGPGDFSHSIGAPGQMDHPDIARARERIATVARKYGKFAGTVGAPSRRQSLIDMGYSFLSLGADVVGLTQYCREIAKACGV
ncbi:MAG: aldolase [Candidatus Pacebacteria bacterium]|nr:aldolase [Candidatus Paceibacterota bacterium]